MFKLKPGDKFWHHVCGYVVSDQTTPNGWTICYNLVSGERMCFGRFNTIIPCAFKITSIHHESCLSNHLKIGDSFGEYAWGLMVEDGVVDIRTGEWFKSLNRGERTWRCKVTAIMEKL